MTQSRSLPETLESSVKCPQCAKSIRVPESMLGRSGEMPRMWRPNPSSFSPETQTDQNRTDNTTVVTDSRAAPTRGSTTNGRSTISGNTKHNERVHTGRPTIRSSSQRPKQQCIQ